MAEPARVDGRFLLRGSIDLVERKPRTTIVRVTDHKTGKNRTTLATMVDGGRVLQPVLYGLALESLTGDLVEEGRLSYCTTAGQFSIHAIPLDALTRRRGVEVLEIIDRAIEHGTLAAKPARDACSVLRLHRGLRPRRGAPHPAQARGPAGGSRGAPPDAMTTDNRHLISDALDDTLVVEAAAGTGKTTELVEARRPPDRDRPRRAHRSDRRRHLQREGRRRAEAAAARGAGTRAPASASGSDGRGPPRARGPALRRVARQHHPRLLRRPAARASGRGVRRSGLQVLTEGQAERLFDEAFADWIQQHLDDPSEGVRRSLRRPRSAWSPDDRDDGPIDRLRRAGLELLQWRDHPAAWTRPAGFDRDREVEALVDALKAFAALSSATDQPRRSSLPQHRGLAPCLGGDRAAPRPRPRRLRRMGGAAVRARGPTHAICCRAKGSGAQFSRTVGRQAVLDAREHLVAALVAFRDRADADLAALVHADFASCIEGYEQRKQKAGALDFLDLLMRARNLVRENEDVRREFQDRFRFILVDEFQDTDPLQAESAARPRLGPDVAASARRPVHRRRSEAVDLPVQARGRRRLPRDLRAARSSRRDAGSPCARRSAACPPSSAR